MPREPEGLRLNVERINEFFEGKELLSVTDVARFERAGRDTIRKRYRWNKFGKMTVMDYARQISVYASDTKRT